MGLASTTRSVTPQLPIKAPSFTSHRPKSQKYMALPYVRNCHLRDCRSSPVRLSGDNIHSPRGPSSVGVEPCIFYVWVRSWWRP